MTVAAVAADPPPMSHPRANILTEGFRTALDRVPENAETMAEHMEHTIRAFSPRNKFHLWISDEIAMMMIRTDRIGRMDRRQRDQSALRAEYFWDDDRRLLAIELSEKLPGRPQKVAAKLKATPQGCDWMGERWGSLQAVLDGGKGWDEAHTAIAFDLLGIDAPFREASAPRLADPAQLVLDEVAALAVQKAKVAESDALERTLAMTDSVAPNTKEYRSLKQYERSTHRRMKWAIELLDLIPKFANAHPDFLEERAIKVAELVAWENYRAAQASRAAEQAPPPPPPPLPQPWVQSTTPPIPVPDLPPLPNPTAAPARRPDPAKLRAKTRSDAARRRREDRPDR